MKNRFAAKANKGFLEIAIGLLAICLSGVFFGGFASADDAAGDVDGSTSTTTSELDTQEQCTWFVTGVPGTVVMIIDPDETITKYDGTDMDLTNETPDALTAYTSGNEGTGNADGNTECTFTTLRLESQSRSRSMFMHSLPEKWGRNLMRLAWDLT